VEQARHLGKTTPLGGLHRQRRATRGPEHRVGKCEDAGATGQNIGWGTAAATLRKHSGGHRRRRQNLWGTSTTTTTSCGAPATDDENIVGGRTLRRPPTLRHVVWSTAADDDKIVWGTAADDDNIVWGTAGLDAEQHRLGARAADRRRDLGQFRRRHGVRLCGRPPNSSRSEHRYRIGDLVQSPDWLGVDGRLEKTEALVEKEAYRAELESAVVDPGARPGRRSAANARGPDGPERLVRPSHGRSCASRAPSLFAMADDGGSFAFSAARRPPLR